MMELGPSEGRDRVLPNLKCTETLRGVEMRLKR